MSQFLDSRHLRLVAEVAATESVTRAADRLNVTQSAVSHQLREIEDRLGTPIFVRSGRRMLPTPAGRLIVEAAGQVLGAIGRVESRIGQLARNVTGELRVCTHCYTGYHWLPPIVDGLRRRYPSFALHIAPEHTFDPIAALLDGKLDLAIMNERSADKRLRYHELFEDEHVAVVPPAHRWTSRPFVTPQELGNEPLYLYSRSIERSFIVKNVLRPAGVEPRNVTYLQLTEGILEMVKAGMGASVLPKWSIATALRSGDVAAVRITRNGVFRKWYAVTQNDVDLTPFVEEFIRLLAKHGPAAGRAAKRQPRLAS
jgi:LysR family transcriptional regulator for metE and metH